MTDTKAQTRNANEAWKGKEKIRRKRKISIPDEKKIVIKSLVDTDMPYGMIKDVMGVSKGTIANVVKEFEESKPLIDFYHKNKLEILRKSQVENLTLQGAIKNSLSQDDIEKWTADQKQRWFSALGVDFGIKYDKERIESGQSTQNVGVVVKAIHEWKRLKENSENSGQN